MPPGPSRRILGIGVARVVLALAAMAFLGWVADLILALPPFLPLAWRGAGIAPLAAGVALEAAATWAFWRHGGGTPHPASPPPRVVDHGPYAYSRNPLYMARVIMLLGVACLLGSTGVLAVDVVLLLGVHTIIIPHEEARLERRLGDAYRDYRRRVGRWITIRRDGTRRRLRTP